MNCIECKTTIPVIQNYGTDTNPLCYKCSDESVKVSKNKIKKVETKLSLKHLIIRFLSISVITLLCFRYGYSGESTEPFFKSWKDVIDQWYLLLLGFLAIVSIVVSYNMDLPEKKQKK